MTLLSRQDSMFTYYVEKRLLMNAAINCIRPPSNCCVTGRQGAGLLLLYPFAPATRCYEQVVFSFLFELSSLSISLSRPTCKGCWVSRSALDHPPPSGSSDATLVEALPPACFLISRLVSLRFQPSEGLSSSVAAGGIWRSTKT